MLSTHPQLLLPPPAATQDSLGSLLRNPTDPGSPASLADQLDDALPLAAIETDLSKLQAAQAVRATLAGLGLQAAADALLVAEQALSGGQAQLEGALAAAEAHLAAYYPAGGEPAGDWVGLVAALQAAAAAAGDAISQAPADASWADQVRTAGGGASAC